MLISVALIILIGFALKGIFEKLKLPGLLGMLITGILIGPYALNLISKEVMDISSELREIALIIILTRVGLSLDLKDLKKVGRSAVLISFLPATLEIIAIVVLAPIFLGITHVEAAIMGAVLAAVSPAIIVPKMLRLMESGYGKEKSIPQLILAGASVDDIYGIVLFTSFMGIYAGDGINPATFLIVPISIISGLVLGIVIGFIFVKLFKAIHMRDTVKVLLLLGISFLIMGIENQISNIIPFSGLLSIIAISATVLKFYEPLAKRINGKFSKMWVGAELFLFVLLGAVVDVTQIGNIGLGILIVLFAGLTMRSIGVIISIIKTDLNAKERIFCIIAYLPKATVQAAIGAIPLAAGVGAGNIILTAAVLAIIVSAPIGAIGMELTYKKLLKNPKNELSQEIK